MPTIARVFDPVKQLWYQDIPGKGRVYDSPAASQTFTGSERPAIPGQPQGGGLFHKNTSWDQNSGEWDAGLDWGKIYAWAIGAGLTVNAAMQIATAATAAGLTAGSAGVGETAGGFGVGGLSATSLGLPATAGLGTAGAAAGLGGAAATTAGLTTGPVAPGAAASSWGPAGAAAGTGSGISEKILNEAKTTAATTGTQKVESLLAGLGGLLGGKALSHYLDPQGGVSPELSQLLQLSLDRAKSQQPLFNQVNSGVSQMLPNFAMRDGSVPGGK